MNRSPKAGLFMRSSSDDCCAIIMHARNLWHDLLF